METKYLLYLWPHSQLFFGIPECISILPPADCNDETLDCAFMVPEHIADKIGSWCKENHRTAPVPESDIRYIKRSGNIIEDSYYDYDGNNFVPQETVNKFNITVVFGDAATKHAKKTSIDDAIRLIRQGGITGSYKSYDFDTMHDRDVAINILQEWEHRSISAFKIGK